MDSIANLSQYRENGPIKARVIWKKAKGYWPTEGFGGNLFNLDLMDATGKIHVTAYQDECEKFYDLIEIGNVYIFSGYCVKIVDIGGFYWPHKHPFEIKLNSTTEVKLCEDNDDEGIPEIKLDLLPICQVWYKGSNEFVDTVGFCTKVGEMAEAYTPTGTKAIRDITLADPMSGDSVTLTLWNNEAKHLDGQLWRIWLGYINPVEDESIEDKYRCSYCKYSLLVNMVIGNWTSNRWVTCFNDAGKQLLKHAVKFHPELEVVGTAQVKHE
ncbi:hypothetical protein ACLKA6_008067 [Drosophila palustris]